MEPGGSGGPDSQQSFLSAQSEDASPRVPELEADPPSWRQLISSDILLRLKKSEVKRQEVINELFITEHAHVRMLKVLYEVFYQRMLHENILSDTELQSIFPSLDELIEVHAHFYENMKKLRQDNGYLVTEIGDTLLTRFHGTEGDWFKKLASRFCSLQSFALELIKSKHRKDPRFSQFIQDAESNPQCRRLQLKDIIPIEMQRLTKYPLLLENIAKYTDQQMEKQQVQQAAECCRNILKDVNQEVRETENLRRLHDYQRRLDISNLRQSSDQVAADFKNIDLTQRRMVHEGPLIWKLTKEKAVDVHVLLLDDILLLMQKVDDKMVLKCHSKNSMGVSEGKQMLCPIIKLGSVLARDVATDRKAFFVLFQTETGAQIYELVAQTVSERKNWCDKILSTQNALNLMRPSMVPRNSLVPPSANIPLSPTMSYREPMLSPENNFSTRDRINSDLNAKESDGVSQDSGTGELSVDDRLGIETLGQSAGQTLAELLKANDVDLAKLASGPSERIADQALEDVHTMKRTLNRSKRTCKDSLRLQPSGEAGQDPGAGASEPDLNSSESREEGGTEAEREKEPGAAEGEQESQSEGENASERGETESTEESTEGQGDEEEQEGEVKGTEDLQTKPQLSEGPGGPSLSGGETESSHTPIVLSLDQAEEMERKMNSLLVKIQHLKAMEEDYHRLRQALVNLTMAPRHSPGNCRRVSGERW
ncbi:rho guanine nucleotide exchange factor 1-like isoform X2 [Heterodontus francisci]|uniref:rho guanine nucleotide exchange factor 1-like isoform X2 n=1 Tax=Heterodontus francisci TaxID=7792 RepID=UPI00355BA3AB